MQLRITPDKILFFAVIFLIQFSGGVILEYFQTGSFSFHIFSISGDHNEFFFPVNTLAEHGKYAMSAEAPPYAGRMPGYMFPYIFFRVLWNESISLYLLGIFQLLIKAGSAVLLWETILKKQNYKMASLALTAYFFIPYYWHWDYIYHPNSVSVSVYVLVLCLLYDLKPDRNRLLLIGTLAAYLFFIRPFLGLYFLPLICFIFFYCRKNAGGYFPAVKAVVIFLLPLLISEVIWTARNYNAFGRLVPFQTSFVPLGDNRYSDYSYDSSTKHSITKVRGLIASWGGESVWYFPGEMRWFMGIDSAFSFNNYVFCKNMNYDSLKSLKNDILLSYHNDFTNQQKDSLENNIIQKSGRYADYYRIEKPLDYWLLSKFRRLKFFLVKNVMQDWPGPSFAKSGIAYQALKLFSLSEYAFMLIFFVAGLFYQMKRKTAFEWLIISNVLILFLTFAVLIEASHYTYFITGYAGLLLLFFNSTHLSKLRKN